MSQIGAPRHDAVPIGEESRPPFARLPDPIALFERRAARLRTLAQGHQLEPYLRFLADLSDAQHRIQAGLPAPEVPPQDAIERAREFAMPPLDRNRLALDTVYLDTLQRFLTEARAIAMPAEAKAALERLVAMTPAELA